MDFKTIGQFFNWKKEFAKGKFIFMNKVGEIFYGNVMITIGGQKPRTDLIWKSDLK